MLYADDGSTDGYFDFIYDIPEEDIGRYKLYGMCGADKTNSNAMVLATFKLK